MGPPQSIAGGGAHLSQPESQRRSSLADRLTMAVWGKAHRHRGSDDETRPGMTPTTDDDEAGVAERAIAIYGAVISILTRLQGVGSYDGVGFASGGRLIGCVQSVLEVHEATWTG